MIVVTGASRGIGRALAVRLHSLGASVGLVARSAEELAALATQLDAGGSSGSGAGRVAVALADVADRERVEAAIGELVEALGPPSALVNNAGIGAYAAVLEEDPAAFERLIAVNYLGTVNATLAVLGGMAERGGGHIVNVSSVAGRLGAPFEAAYSGSKFAVVGFSESLAAEMGALGVKVSLIEPGPVSTSFTDARGVPFQRERPRPLDPERVVDAIVGTLESGRTETVLPRWLRFPIAVRAVLPGAYFSGVRRDARRESAALALRLQQSRVVKPAAAPASPPEPAPASLAKPSSGTRP